MTTIEPTRPEASTRSSAVAIWRTGIVAALVAAVAVLIVAVVGDAIDVPLEVAGDEIPLAGFPLTTLLWSVVGILLAWGLERWTRRARTEFVVVTLVLVALSMIPVVTADAETATKVLLTLTHLVAAAIVIPVLETRLHDR